MQGRWIPAGTTQSKAPRGNNGSLYVGTAYLSRAERGLTPADQVWNQQLGDWRPASQIAGLFPTAPPMPPPPPSAAPYAYGAVPPQRSRLLYWLIRLLP
jgi:hypothetical protein